MRTERVYYSGPEPGMVPGNLADFECEHGHIEHCKICDPPKKKIKRIKKQ